MANPTLNVALLMTAAKKELASKGLLTRLRAAKATNVRAAHRLDDLDQEDRALLDQQLKAGNIRDAGDGRYWVDEERIADVERRAKRVALIACAFLISAGVSLIVLLAS